uniref:Uncharacterized protein n=1 Tax=Oryza brachyantha TaxID=4533 RepID=J3L5Q5_ORYBR
MHACSTHRVFCDAQAEETARLNAASTTVAAAAHVHHAARSLRRHVQRHNVHRLELPVEVDVRSRFI